MAGDFDSYPADIDSEQTPKVAPEQTPKPEFAPVSVAGGGQGVPTLSNLTLSRVSAVAGERDYVKGRKVLETLGDPEE
jgi:hypothetical protein